MERIPQGRRPRHLTDEEITSIVEEVLETLPEDLQEAIANVGISIEDLPTREMLEHHGHSHPPTILGLYVGVPLPQQSVFGPAPIPAQIFLFRRNIERYGRYREDLLRDLRDTLLHEIGHHLGLGEEDLRKRGL